MVRQENRAVAAALLLVLGLASTATAARVPGGLRQQASLRHLMQGADVVVNSGTGSAEVSRSGPEPTAGNMAEPGNKE